MSNYSDEDINKLINISIETAFDENNEDTELLCRRLLAMGLIKLEDGMYTRDPLDFEKTFTIDGVKFDKEKAYFIDNDKLDEYTKQLEYKLNNIKSIIDQEINELKQYKETVHLDPVPYADATYDVYKYQHTIETLEKIKRRL